LFCSWLNEEYQDSFLFFTLLSPLPTHLKQSSALITWNGIERQNGLSAGLRKKQGGIGNPGKILTGML
jgi:hypothetical protein